MLIPTKLIIKWYAEQVSTLVPLAVQAQSGLSVTPYSKSLISKTHLRAVPPSLRTYMWRFNTTKLLNEAPIQAPSYYRTEYWLNKKKYFPVRYLRSFYFFSTYYAPVKPFRVVSGRRFVRRGRFARTIRAWGFNFWPYEAAVVALYTASKVTDTNQPATGWYLGNFSRLILKTLWCRSLSLLKSRLVGYSHWMEIRKQVYKALCFMSVKIKTGRKWKKVSNVAGLLSWTHLGTKAQWGLRNPKFKYSKKNMYVYLRYLKLFWRIARTRDLGRVLNSKVFTSSVYQQTNFKKYFGLRLESFLVSTFRVKTLQHARALIRNGHVFVNGSRVLNEGVSLKRLDVVTFSTRALVWLRLLRRIRRNRKVRKFDRRIVSRRGSASVIYGPKLSHAVVWNTTASVRELANCRRLPVFGANEQKHLSVALRTLSR